LLKRKSDYMDLENVKNLIEELGLYVKKSKDKLEIEYEQGILIFDKEGNIIRSDKYGNCNNSL